MNRTIAALGLVVALAQAGCPAPPPAKRVEPSTVDPTDMPWSHSKPENEPAPPGGTTGRASSSSPTAVVARRVAGALVAGDFTAATAPFDAKMRESLSAGAVQAAWEQVMRGKGKIVRVGPVQLEPKGSYDMGHVTVVCETGAIDVQVVVSRETGEVGGLWLRPPGWQQR